MNIFNVFDRGLKKSQGAIKLATNEHAHNDFIRLLSIAALLRVKIVPLTWSPALEGLGAGATSQISQSSLNARVTFAFKRFDHVNSNPRISPDRFRARQYDAMAAEIVALNSPLIYDHPNIVNLEGISWEILEDGLEVWPVLVFRRAECGDLRNYLSSPEGARGSFDFRLENCAAILKALKAVHECGIVHGDIKPENVLVTKHQHPAVSGQPTVYSNKMIDFGYSCLGSKEEDLVMLPHSKPWQAPEYHPRWFRFKDAKKMDIYSAGLLCLWILFLGETLTSPNHPAINVQCAFAGGDEKAQEILESLKEEDSISTCALNLVSNKPGLSQEKRDCLQNFLTHALQRDPGKRNVEMSSFIELFSACDDEDGSDVRAERPSRVDSPASIPAWHGSFQIAELLFVIESCDFRVHAYICAQLKAAAEKDGCKACSSNAAFQIALCYSIGFGVRADRERMEHWLLQSERGPKGLERALESLRRLDPPRTSYMGELIDLGYSSPLAEDYDNQGILDQALTEYKAMVISREQVLGETHFSSRRMRSILGGLLRRAGYLESAAETIMKEISLTKRLDRARDGDITILKQMLARIYGNMGKLEEAEALNLEILHGCSENSDKYGFSRITALYHLSSNSLGQGRDEEAIKRALLAVEESMKLLGPDHYTTLKAQENLALAYTRSGLLLKAVELTEHVSRNWERLQGLNYHQTSNSQAMLGALYIKLQRWKEAHDIFATVMKVYESFFGKNSITTMIAAANFASTLAQLGQIEGAQSLQKEILGEIKRTLGEEDVNTVNLLGNLAVTYQLQEAWDKAESIETQVLDYRRRHASGGSCVELLPALQNLSYTKLKLRKWCEAAELSLEELDMRRNLCKSANDDPDEAKLMAVMKAARALASLERWDDAIIQIDREISWRKEMEEGEVSMDIMRALSLAVSANMKLGKSEEARARLGEFFEASLQMNGAYVSFPQIIHDLATLCDSEKWWAEAEQLAVLELLVRIQICPGDQVGMEEAKRGLIRFIDLQGKPAIDESGVRFDPTDIITRGKKIREEMN